MCALQLDTQGGSRVRESRLRGSVRGARGNSRPYRDQTSILARDGYDVNDPTATLAVPTNICPKPLSVPFLGLVLAGRMPPSGLRAAVIRRGFSTQRARLGRFRYGFEIRADGSGGYKGPELECVGMYAW
jgi:hypothetical protein